MIQAKHYKNGGKTMKRIVTTLCALAVIMVGSIPAMAAEEPPRQDASYYPISVDEYTYGYIFRKTSNCSQRNDVDG